MKLKTLDPIVVLSIILGLAAILRVMFADQPGNGFDIGVNQGWAKSAVELGVARSYTEQVDGNMLPNYPPLSLLLFAATGHIFKFFVSPEFDSSLPSFIVAIKIPAILADLIIICVLFFAMRRWKGILPAYATALVYALHPAILYDSAVWGQTDSIFTLFMVLAITMYARGWYGFAGSALTFAFLCKMQTVMIIPIFAWLLLLLPMKGRVKAVSGALVATALVLLPFAMGDALDAIWNVYTNSVGYYSIVSSAAYNFWWALLGDNAGNVTDTDLLFNVISYRRLGLLLYAMTAIWTVVVLTPLIRPSAPENVKGPAMFLAASICAYAFFLFNTQMHERYLFPLMAFGIPGAVLSGRQARLYGWASLFFFINLLGWLPLSAVDRALFSTFEAFDVSIAVLQLFTFAGYIRTTDAVASSLKYSWKSPWTALRNRFRHKRAFTLGK